MWPPRFPRHVLSFTVSLLKGLRTLAVTSPVFLGSHRRAFKVSMALKGLPLALLLNLVYVASPASWWPLMVLTLICWVLETLPPASCQATSPLSLISPHHRPLRWGAPPTGSRTDPFLLQGLSSAGGTTALQLPQPGTLYLSHLEASPISLFHSPHCSRGGRSQMQIQSTIPAS